MPFFGMGNRSATAPAHEVVNFDGDPWNSKHGRPYLAMSTTERRKHYKCGNKYQRADDIPVWPAYYKVHTSKNLLNAAKKRKKGTDRNIERYRVDLEMANKISIWQGDITCLEIDAIVNAANGSLLGGGGVDGCIHRASGQSLKEECRTLDGCHTGCTKITGGHKLPSKYVLHTVGPQNRSEDALTRCYSSCLQLVREYNIKTIAFCCISTGIYGYPNEDAAHVALSVARKFLERFGDEVDRIIFCTYLPDDFKIYESLMTEYYFPCDEKQPIEDVENTSTGDKENGKQPKEAKEHEDDYDLKIERTDNKNTDAESECAKEETTDETVKTKSCGIDEESCTDDISESKDVCIATKAVDDDVKTDNLKSPEERESESTSSIEESACGKTFDDKSKTGVESESGKEVTTEETSNVKCGVESCNDDISNSKELP